MTNPLKQGLKLSIRDGFGNKERVVMTNPLKQGLKLNKPYMVPSQSHCRNDESTKTRIETTIMRGIASLP